MLEAVVLGFESYIRSSASLTPTLTKHASEFCPYILSLACIHALPRTRVRVHSDSHARACIIFALIHTHVYTRMLSHHANYMQARAFNAFHASRSLAMRAVRRIHMHAFTCTHPFSHMREAEAAKTCVLPTHDMQKECIFCISPAERKNACLRAMRGHLLVSCDGLGARLRSR